LAALRLNDPSRVYRCSSPLTTKNPLPSTARSVGRPVGSIAPAVKFFSIVATTAPRPRWLGFVPPKSPLGGVPPLSVT
jgi:hypothetical protein